MKIFLVEDDNQLSKLVSEHLQKYGYEVQVPADFQNIVENFSDFEPDLVLLDINLPYYDGFFLCRSIRQVSNVPIIIISARNSNMDQVLGMELGADDYITKPFTFDILLSKIKATFRRVYGEYAEKEERCLVVGQLKLDKQALTINVKDNTIELSKNEFLLVKKLMEQHKTFVTREEMMEIVWDSIHFVDDNTLTVNMTRIKRKLASLGLENVITSKRGVGYKLIVPVGITHG
ncbi:Response regulator protein GraR [Bacillus sp. THAF10]|uniref:response regulator transcription factor n=1 Tax=Bacillus sp. THAF10 TaxID=2587848 RepID=UPI001267DBF7|nr:response regulator transcription factor [Bacillus sp. THAF10]QFT89559.1 Response regulator protein GraR [Bacillus sp. THAF10]